MTKKDILIVDDDLDLAMITRDLLEDYRYSVEIARSTQEAFEKLTEIQFKLILLDINLPDGSGFEICQALRKHSTVPILFVSARTSEQDRIIGLDMGADDYLSKPYSLKELLSRINANIRRAYGFREKEQSHQLGDLEVNITARTVKRDGKDISLSLKEFDLLKYMLEHKNSAIKKERLLAEVWGAFSEVEVATVSVHIRWLREKLEIDPSKPCFIKTVWGVGYLLADGVGENET